MRYLLAYFVIEQCFPKFFRPLNFLKNLMDHIALTSQHPQTDILSSLLYSLPFAFTGWHYAPCNFCFVSVG